MRFFFFIFGGQKPSLGELSFYIANLISAPEASALAFLAGN